MKYDFQTAGEQLAYFIEDRLLKRSSWSRFAETLLFTGRSDELCDFFHEVTVINLACKIVTAGRSLLAESGDRPTRAVSDSSFVKEFGDFARDRLNLRPPLSGDLLRNAIRAVQSSQHDATPKERNTFKRWAEREHRACYLCGSELDFEEKDGLHKFSLDHIWPQRFGGDSIEDNWLPACGMCNNKKKRDFATWAMPDIQSLVLGFEPSANEYTSVHGGHRFALHHLAAKKVAVKRNISLKRAFMFLGPWESSPRLVDEHDIGDFFNLAIHRSDLELT